MYIYLLNVSALTNMTDDECPCLVYTTSYKERTQTILPFSSVWLKISLNIFDLYYQMEEVDSPHWKMTPQLIQKIKTQIRGLFKNNDNDHRGKLGLVR